MSIRTITSLILFACLLVACTTETVDPGPTVPIETATIHPLFQQPGTVLASEPRPATTAAPTRAAAPTATQPQTDTATPATGDSTTEAPTEAPPTEEIIERPICSSLEELADIQPPYYVLPGPWPAPEPLPLELFQVATASRYIHLGFDVEQDPAPVTDLLDVLASHGIYTNFFILGSWAEENPELVAAIAEAGHEIGNHSYAHERMGEWSAEDILADLTQAEEILQQMTGRSTQPWFRPPFGNRSEASIQVAYDAGWSTVTWSGGSNDFVEGTPEEVQNSICSDFLEGAQPGAILISHTFNEQTPAAVDRFIREMHAAGYVFMPLSVLTAPFPDRYLINQQQ
ncbi:MAG: polysaccharide deacetylase family protein [Anaerolineales bacterium]|nr:polysaccharide deacetylase family protein [Anaerolineales bacterium]MCB8959242.1 polysaccharide deacetylase family protein [Ardenticatenales bacterium]